MYRFLRQEVILLRFLPSFAFWNMQLTICYRVKATPLFILISNCIIEPQGSALRLNFAFVIEACMRVAGSVQQPQPRRSHTASTKLHLNSRLVVRWNDSLRHRISPAKHTTWGTVEASNAYFASPPESHCRLDQKLGIAPCNVIQAMAEGGCLT